MDRNQRAQCAIRGTAHRPLCLRNHGCGSKRLVESFARAFRILDQVAMVAFLVVHQLFDSPDYADWVIICEAAHTSPRESEKGPGAAGSRPYGGACYQSPAVGGDSL